MVPSAGECSGSTVMPLTLLATCFSGSLPPAGARQKADESKMPCSEGALPQPVVFLDVICLS